MENVSVTTSSGEEIVLEAATIKAFASHLRGPMLRPGEDAYEEARAVWNGLIDRRPALIVRCAGVSDVIRAVDFARAHQLLVSVRGGGHNVPGNSVCDGGLMIDLAGMRSIRVDPHRRTAQAEGGATWGEFDHETQAFGLATTGGAVSDTGIAGLTLGGGLGWLAGKYGLACDNLLAADIVTADGDLLMVSASDHADLFWGLRGGGGNFGVVTSLTYQLHPVGPLLAGHILYPVTQAREVLRFYRDFSCEIPDEVNTVAGLTTSPDGAPVLALLLCYNGPLAAGEEALRPMRAFGAPLVDEICPRPYAEVQRQLDAASPRGRRYYIKANFVTDISDAAIDLLVEHFATVPSPFSLIAFQQLGGAVGRVGSKATAFYHREARYEWFVQSAWEDPGENAANIQWTRALAEAMEPCTTGRGYVNHLGPEAMEGAASLRSAYGPHYESLVALKNQYDPTNLFRLNANITPTV